MMPSLDLVVLAIALAIDAAAVAASLGAARQPIAVLLGAAGLFGVFQALMSGAGALGGEWLVAVAAAWDHWIAFGLLAAVGGRMLLPGDDEEDEAVEGARVSLHTLVVLAVATSIDALAAGVSLPVLADPIVLSLVTIGAVTLGLAAVAAAVGRTVGAGLGPYVERIGGVVLIGLGLKILVEHLLAG